MTTRRPLTIANQQAMEQQLQQLADSHKKAKLQELFTRQDELRPFTLSDAQKLKHQKEKIKQKEQEMAAMKSQFHDLQKEQLKKQITKQFLLRLPSHDEDDDDAKKEYVTFYGYGSDGSGEQKIDAADIEAMKAEFDKYQKSLLSTQIEKSFRLRVPGEENDENIDENTLEKEKEKEKEEKLNKSKDVIKSIEEMKKKFQAMNKMMLSYRSTKQLEGTIVPQIKPAHHERFNMLMKDIGIVNSSITDKLWKNIADTVHIDDNEMSAELDLDIDVDLDFEDEEIQTLRQQIFSLKQENERLKDENMKLMDISSKFDLEQNDDEQVKRDKVQRLSALDIKQVYIDNVKLQSQVKRMKEREKLYEDQLKEAVEEVADLKSKEMIGRDLYDENQSLKQKLKYLEQQISFTVQNENDADDEQVDDGDMLIIN